MIVENEFLTPEWPPALQHVDIVKTRFVLDFVSPCQLRPADFLGIGRILRVVARQGFDARDVAAVRQQGLLFQPPLSDDPVARRRFQKPAPAFVITMPVMQEQLLDIGDRLELDVLFLGNGIPFIHNFLGSLIHLGSLGLVAGEGCFEVTAVCSRQADFSETLVWRQGDPLDNLTCVIQPLSWLLQRQQVPNAVTLEYLTPTRLLVNGKPLRRPRFAQVFPFMLRRVTSMLYAHSGVEVVDDPGHLLALAGQLEVLESQLRWQDWRSISARQDLTIGGFVGEMQLAGNQLDELYWVIAIASLFGIGKAAAYGAGRILIHP